MKRGDIYYANLDPTIGNEIQKKRPVLIVSNDANNEENKLLTVLPITSNIKKVYRFEVLLPAKQTKLIKESKAQAQQIRTISVNRICSSKITTLTQEIMKKIDHAINVHLDLLT